jgi:hypothetical protein
MIVAYLNGTELPPLELDFVNKNVENATDVVMLDGSMRTDFVANNFDEWLLQWDSLTEAEYSVIRAIYDAQFTTYQYPTLSIPYYSVTDVPVRMRINEKDIWNHCGAVQNVQISLRETTQMEEVS